VGRAEERERTGWKVGVRGSLSGGGLGRLRVFYFFASALYDILYAYQSRFYGGWFLMMLSSRR